MAAEAAPNVQIVAPSLVVSDMERSLAFYVDGLGFAVQNRWIPDGSLRWCWMMLGEAPLMLQQGATGPEKVGVGVGLYFQCRDALAVYREAASRGLQTVREPQVGNGGWEVSFRDPDGYHINFFSPTDQPEDMLLSEFEAMPG